MTVATKRLAVHHSAGTRVTVQLYVCPIGYRTIVKSVLVASRAAAPATVLLWLGSGDGLVNPSFFRGTLEPAAYEQGTSWLVMHGNDSIYADVDVAGVDIWLSGTELILPT